MIKIGLIGAGFMGTTHSACYEILQKQGDVRITAVADLDLNRAVKLAEKFGAVVYESGMELIDKADVDTVDICLPTYLHAEHALKAIEMGYNTFIEKPVCLSADEANKLIEARNNAGVKVMVGQCIRLWPEYVYLKELIDTGKYGKLRNAMFKRISPRPDWAWDGWILDTKRSGSAALDLHIHDVDFVNYILGQPDTISAALSYTGKNPEHALSLYKYGDVMVSLEGGWDYPTGFPFEMDYRVNFEQAAVVFNSNKSPSVTVYMNNGDIIEPVIKAELEENKSGLGGNISSLGGYYNELRYFVDRIKNGSEIKVASLEEGLSSLKLVLREFEAAGRK